MQNLKTHETKGSPAYRRQAIQNILPLVQLELPTNIQSPSKSVTSSIEVKSNWSNGVSGLSPFVSSPNKYVVRAENILSWLRYILFSRKKEDINVYILKKIRTGLHIVCQDKFERRDYYICDTDH